MERNGSESREAEENTRLLWSVRVFPAALLLIPTPKFYPKPNHLAGPRGKGVSSRDTMESKRPPAPWTLMRGTCQTAAGAR
jgi:hypothetical protein